MKKLSILIPQYNETEDMIKLLLDSIEQQQNINFDDIEVIIGNDGSETLLTEEFLNNYTYSLQYLIFEHGGLAATRYRLFERSGADYVMFCDADDYFINNVALAIIFNELKNPIDALVCDFLKEDYRGHNSYTYELVTKDSIHVHGKVYRKKFLIDNNIIWHSDLKEHQDSPYNGLAMVLATKKKTIEYLPIALYLWHYNKNSISRTNDHHFCRTMTAFINSMDHYIEDLLLHNCYTEAGYYMVYLLYYFYYNLTSAEWFDEIGRQFQEPAYIRLSQFIIKYQILIRDNFKKYQKIGQEQAYNLLKGRFDLSSPAMSFEKWLTSYVEPCMTLK